MVAFVGMRIAATCLGLLVGVAACSSKPQPPGPEPTPRATPTPTPTPSPDPEPVNAPLEPTHILRPDVPLTLDDGTTLMVEMVVAEQIEASPEGDYPAGSAISVPLVLRRGSYEERASLLDITEGYDAQMVAWLAEYRVELVEVREFHRDPQVHLVIETVADTRTDAAPTRIRIERGQTVQLGETEALEFTGHGHKRTFEGQDSPLIISMRWHASGAEPVDHSVNLETSRGDRSWRFRDHEVTLREWEYDAWMELEVHALARNRVPSH